MNNKVLEQLSLEAGGAHYPSINPQMQEKFAQLIIQQCINLCTQAAKESEQAFNACISSNETGAALVAKGAAVQSHKLARVIEHYFND